MIGQSHQTPASTEGATGAAPGRPASPESVPAVESPAQELGGRDGPDPTRYGDWEKNGRCIDF